MRILGVDPGYRNLGLALLDINEEQRIVTPLWSGSLSVGTADNGLNYVKFLWPKLNEIYAEHGCDGVASETPPFIMRQIKTTAMLWSVSSVISCWAYTSGLSFRHAAPMTLKRAVSRALGRKFERKKVPKKSDVKTAVEQYMGTSFKTSHENDAALAAILLYSDLIPKTNAA